MGGVWGALFQGRVFLIRLLFSKLNVQLLVSMSLGLRINWHIELLPFYGFEKNLLRQWAFCHNFMSREVRKLVFWDSN